jgi:hypothetical protein
MEYDSADGIYGMRCSVCHDYIIEEMRATSLAVNVSAKHRAAAEDANYAGPGKELNFSQELPVFEGGHVNPCLLCHLAEQDSLAWGITGSHTKLVIRVCTDEDCHGNSTTRGVEYPAYSASGYVGMRLANTTDLHSGWFRALENWSAKRYPNEDGGNYSYGFYACLGCHTHVGVDMVISRPQSYIINISINQTDPSKSFIYSVEINESSRNTTYSTGSVGSKWK